MADLTREFIEKLRSDVKDLDASDLDLDPEYLYGMVDMLQWLWAGVTVPAEMFAAGNHTLAKVIEAVQQRG